MTSPAEPAAPASAPADLERRVDAVISAVGGDHREAIAELLGCPLAEVGRVLAQLQRLDPAGVLARDLKECLALQLRDRNRYDPCMAALLDNLPMLAQRDIAGLRRVCGGLGCWGSRPTSLGQAAYGRRRRQAADNGPVYDVRTDRKHRYRLGDRAPDGCRRQRPRWQLFRRRGRCGLDRRAGQEGAWRTAQLAGKP